jgi:hypothetical protein
MNNGRASCAGILSRTGIDDADGFSAVFMKLTDGAAFVLLSFARKLVGAATVGEARADIGAVAPCLLGCFAPVVDSLLLFAPRSASIFPFIVAAVAACAWSLPIDANARRLMLVVTAADAGLLVEDFIVIGGVRVASLRVGSVESIVGLVPEGEGRDNELPIAGIET